MKNLYYYVALPGFWYYTIPGVREAIEQRDWKQADEQIKVVSEIIDSFSDNLDKAVRILNE